nr:AEC family transporter [Melioribacteraceae bacterium]
IFNIKISILFNSLSLLGETAGGIAIFSLGIFIYDNFEYEKLKKAFRFSIFRFLILPLVTFIILSFFSDIDNEMKSFVFLQSGIPAAISLAVFAERYEYKLAEITGIVILTSIFSAIGIMVLFLISKNIFPF